MSQSNCPSLYQIDTRLWVSILPEKIGDPVTVDEISHSESDKFYRSGFQWISDYTYITNDDIIVGGRRSKTNEMTFVERSVIVEEPNFKNLMTIQINYLIPQSQWLLKFSLCS